VTVTGLEVTGLEVTGVEVSVVWGMGSCTVEQHGSGSGRSGPFEVTVSLVGSAAVALLTCAPPVWHL